MKFLVLHLDSEKIEQFEVFDDFLGNGFLVDKKTNERVIVRDSTGRMTGVEKDVNEEPVFVNQSQTLNICSTKKAALEKSKNLLEKRIENLNLEKKIKKDNSHFEKFSQFYQKRGFENKRSKFDSLWKSWRGREKGKS